MNHYAELQAAKHCLEQMRQAIREFSTHWKQGPLHKKELERIAAIADEPLTSTAVEHCYTFNPTTQQAYCVNCGRTRREAEDQGCVMNCDRRCVESSPTQIPSEWREETDRRSNDVDTLREDATQNGELEEHGICGDGHGIGGGNRDSLPAAEVAHKCQNNIDAATGECAVCAFEKMQREIDSEWMNAPMGSPDAPCDHHFVYGEAARMHYCEKCGAKWEDCPEDHSADCLCWSCRKRKDTPSDAPPDAPLCQHCKTPLPDHYVAVYSNANDCTKYCSEECAVAAGASGLLERPNGDAPPDAPTCHNTTCRCYDTDADNNCGARDEFGELVPISECHDAILSPPSDALPDAPRMIECPKCGDIGIGLGEHTCNDAPMRPVALDNSYSQRNNHYHCLHSHADAIERLDNASAREAKRWRLKYNDLQQQIDALKTDPLTGRPPDSEEWQRLNEMRQQINSHTTITHGEIERRLTEMGQKIEKLEQRISCEKGEE